MRKIATALVVAAVLGGTGSLEAQDTREGSWWAPAALALLAQGTDAFDRNGSWDPYDRDGRYDRDERYDRDDRYDRRDGEGRRGKGPPFCRSGRGHPVHGMEWCARKGWAGHGDRSGLDRWMRAGWGDVILRSPRRDSRQRMGEPSLVDILGQVVLGRLTDHGRRSGMAGSLDGRWLPTDRGSVLQLRMGGVPLAELADANRDGRADLVLLSRR